MLLLLGETSRNHSVANLVEITMTEKQFQRSKKAITATMASPDVEGVYQTQMTPSFRAILSLGAVAQVGKAKRNAMLMDSIVGAGGQHPPGVFNLHELEWLTTTTHPYLEPHSGVFRLVASHHPHYPFLSPFTLCRCPSGCRSLLLPPCIRRVYIYHSQAKGGDNRGVVGVFIINETNAEIAEAAAKVLSKQIDSGSLEPQSVQELTIDMSGETEGTGGHDHRYSSAPAQPKRRNVALDAAAASAAVGGVHVPITIVSHTWQVSPTRVETLPVRALFRRVTPNKDNDMVRSKVYNVSNFAEAWKGVDKVLREYHNQRNGPTMVSLPACALH